MRVEKVNNAEKRNNNQTKKSDKAATNDDQCNDGNSITSHCNPT